MTKKSAAMTAEINVSLTGADRYAINRAKDRIRRLAAIIEAALIPEGLRDDARVGLSDLADQIQEDTREIDAVLQAADVRDIDGRPK
jgi:hypothetical protein